MDDRLPYRFHALRYPYCMKVMPHREPRCVWLELNDPYVPCTFVSQRHGIQSGTDTLAEKKGMSDVVQVALCRPYR